MTQLEMLKYYYDGFKRIALPDCLTEQSKLDIITTLEQSAENYAKFIPESKKDSNHRKGRIINNSTTYI